MRLLALSLVVVSLAACPGRPPVQQPDGLAPVAEDAGPSSADAGEGKVRDAGFSVFDGGEGPLPCSQDALDEVFEERIGPILSDEHLDSCNACHFDGVDLSAFARPTACESMECLLALEWVDLDAPEDSLLLTFIDRAADAGLADSGITAETVAAEHDAFREWIELSARCHEEICGPLELTCELSPVDAGPAPLDAGLDDAGVQAGPPTTSCHPDGGLANPLCSEAALGAYFEETLWHYKGRCAHCHEEGGGLNIGAPPKWMANTEQPSAPAQTLCSIRERGYFDLVEPEQSLLLLKPLNPTYGGVEHGGGNKFTSLDDPAYGLFLQYIEREAWCFGPPPADGGTAPLDAGPVDIDAGAADLDAGLGPVDEGLSADGG